MADEIDRANDYAARMASAAVAEICRAAGKQQAQPTGLCLYCAHVVMDAARWCDAECRDDWEWINARKR